MASRKTTRGAAPLVRSSNSASCSAWKNERLRTSTTAARPGACSSSSGARSREASSTNGFSICGGRLSTTYQPRSSRTLAVVERPALDIPVTITSCGCCGCWVWSWLMRSCLVVRPSLSSGARSVVEDLTGAEVDRGNRPGRGRRGRRRPPARWPARCPGPGRSPPTSAARSFFSEPKCFSSAVRRVGPRPGIDVQRARRHRARPALAVVGDREPVRLVADPLQQVEALAAARQDHRVVVARAARPPRAAWPARPATRRRCRGRPAPGRRPPPAAGRRRRRRAAAGRRTSAAGRSRGRCPGRSRRRWPPRARRGSAGTGG